MCSESDQYMCDWENKYNEQCELTNEIITQYNSLKLNENIIKNKLKEMKELKDRFYTELCSYKAEMEEKNDLVQKLNTNLKSMEEENCNLRRQIIDVNSQFGMDSKYTTTENLDSMKQVETNPKLEQDKLSAKFNTVCKKLYEMKIAFSDVRNTINCDIFNIENVVDAIKRLSEAEKCKQKLLIQIHKLKDKNCLVDDELTRRNKKIKELQRENEYYVCKINKHKKQLQEWNIKKENVSLSKNICEQIEQKNNCCCVHKNI